MSAGTTGSFMNPELDALRPYPFERLKALMASANAPTDLCVRFDHLHICARLVQHGRCSKPCQTGTDYDDIHCLPRKP